MLKDNNKKVMVIRIDNNTIQNRSLFLSVFKDHVINSAHRIISIHSDSKIEDNIMNEISNIASMNNRLLVTTCNPNNGDYIEALADIIQGNSRIALTIDNLAKMSGKNTVFSRLNPNNIQNGLQQLKYSKAECIIAIIRGPKGFKFREFQDIERELNAERSPLATLSLGFVEKDIQTPYELDLFMFKNTKSDKNHHAIDIKTFDVKEKDNKTFVANESYLMIPQCLRRSS